MAVDSETLLFALNDLRRQIVERDQRIEELKAGYREAIEDIAEWAAYANEHFQKKHNLAGILAAHRKTLEDE